MDQLFTNLLSFDKFNFINLFSLFLVNFFSLSLSSLFLNSSLLLNSSFSCFLFPSELLKCINFLKPKIPQVFPFLTIKPNEEKLNWRKQATFSPPRFLLAKQHLSLLKFSDDDQPCFFKHRKTNIFSQQLKPIALKITFIKSKTKENPTIECTTFVLAFVIRRYRQ